MKQLFIFYLLLLFGFGCAHQKSANHNNPNLVLSAEAVEWRSFAPGEDDFTEHGVDLTIKLSDQFNEAQFRYVIYDGRKSFPVTVHTAENSTLWVQARVIYESDLLADTSTRSDLTDRLVFLDEDGTTDFTPIQSWTEKPLSYR
jgi:hypothetical protein